VPQPLVLPMDRTDRHRPAAGEGADAGVRELMAVREIVQAFLNARRPAELYQFALDRVSPIVGASFACVYVVEEGSDLMRLEAVHNWPQRYAGFLKDLRVRLGAGPSGEAASERRVVEVPDVYADESLQEWREVAHELGFRSLVALPLQTARGIIGAVTFYFTHAGGLSHDGRGLLRVVADQMAASAEKAALIDELSRANDALTTTNAELERQYVAVLEARRLQDEFLANVSHELRTPLTAVMGYIALMEEGLAGPMSPEQEHTLAQVRGASDQLLGLIGDLLELTSLKRGELVVNVTEFDAADVVREARQHCTGCRDGVTLVIEPSAPIAMATDRRKLTRVLAALLGNAFKFTEQGEVRVATRTEGNLVMFAVSDTGVGISADAQAFVFDEFRQEDGSATRRYGGSGLGLAIARRLARLLGGDVRMSSSRGKGSSFIAEIPVRYTHG
jgi:signal transduction histidine kinase